MIHPNSYMKTKGYIEFSNEVRVDDEVSATPVQKTSDKQVSVSLAGYHRITTDLCQ